MREVKHTKKTYIQGQINEIINSIEDTQSRLAEQIVNEVNRR